MIQNKAGGKVGKTRHYSVSVGLEVEVMGTFYYSSGVPDRAGMFARASVL